MMRASLALLGLSSPVILWTFLNGLVSGNIEQALLGAYATSMAALSAYFINRAMHNPDRLHIDDQGFTYKFMNITFRVRWEDVEQIELANAKVIKIRLNDPKRVAFSSLVGWPLPLRRTQHNPYSWIGVRKLFQFKLRWPRNSVELADLLEEAGERNGYHIAIPIFESAEEAERVADEMKTRHRQYQPGYRSAVYEPEPVLTAEHPGEEINQQAPRPFERERP